jgi:predicted transcriptional regulator
MMAYHCTTFPGHIIIGDKMQVHYLTSIIKAVRMAWKRTSPAIETLKSVVMLLWDTSSIVHLHFLEYKAASVHAHHCYTALSQFPGLLTDKVIPFEI